MSVHLRVLETLAI